MSNSSTWEPLVFCPTCRREFAGDRRLCPADGAELRTVPSDTPRPGSLLDDRLLVVDRIGAGGMGTIFRALQLDTRQHLALKVLKPRFGQDLSAVGQFYHEARAARRLRHPSIVRIDSFGRSSEGHLYIAMELLGGVPLSSYLATCEPLDPALAVHVARHVCAALGAAHRKGTIHRDLKPENIQIIPRPDGPPIVKVLDFGIASVLAFDIDRGVSPEEHVSGTPAYMSPEQVMGHPVDPRSDLYGLGVLLFEMLVGRAPFDAETPIDLCRKHLTEDAPDISDLLPRGAVPVQLAKLVRHLLRKQPARRPRSAAAAVRRLEQLQELVGEPPWVSADDTDRPHDAEPDPAPAAAEPVSRCRPPMLRSPRGTLRIMPLKGGGVPTLTALPEMPDAGRPTLVDMARPLDAVVEAMTLRNALWICPRCSFLNANASGSCGQCDASLEGPRVGVPVTAERRPTNPPHEPSWSALSEEQGGRIAVPLTPGPVAVDCVDVELTPELGPPVDVDWEAEELRTDAALLHVTLSAERADGSPLPVETLRKLLDPWLLRWRASLADSGGFVCRDEGNVLRAVFGLLPDAPPRWMEAAATAAVSLRETISEAGAELEIPIYLRGALALGRVHLEPAAMGHVDVALRGSPVDLATRLARNAPAGEILTNAAGWRRIAESFGGQACDTIRARGARNPELVYRLGKRKSRDRGVEQIAEIAEVSMVEPAAPPALPALPPLPPPLPSV